MEMKRILVAGATGYLGRFLVQALKTQGYWVRILVRNHSQTTLFTDVDDIFIGEITKPEQLKNSTKDIDCVISTVGITRQKEGLTYMDVDYQANVNLLDEAIKSQVKQFIYISAIDGDKYRQLKIFEAKERFVDKLKQSTLSYCVIRPNGYFSDMGDFLHMATSNRVYLFGSGEQQINPISGKDLAQFIIKMIGHNTKEISVGGPDILSLNQIAELAGVALNKKIKIIHLPDALRKMTIFILRHVTSQKFYGPFEFFLTFMGTSHIGEVYGDDHLSDYYLDLANKFNSKK
ncbi:NAD(P)H-binding protein [Proteus sp. G2665]|nr:NAD(P)H-binding protein [Proteus sp. G2672]NBL89307.1 NAD(P)H-binding protein [Proteus sp. G2673]NBM02720.1 NAD(P)H-binding protein [Proteus sp. G2671]NBM13044.1 NAD(P)H-binding protein [Proteus sp. G2670]NBM33327.1 NAD(P)H-binding protein [Proteus sp. G2664]NBM51011.1 NAD(P)H-binding protein [Proteus sp. G2666]NBM57527.1 NAD(P)H-binding protein [Proteus sp. G2667]NBM68272.1 NAD(P)H-binding protein [Proteus sp. G2663]NBM80636.1 NAD(P)H-binding protein [Proteus sp. G2659]NBM88248.1 NAD(P